jgi:2'-5' RNA ligase
VTPSSARPADEPGTLVVGVAIAVPPPHAEDLQRWRAEFGDPLADAIPPHVTLLPPLRVPVASMPVVHAHLEGVAATAAPFEMHLRGTGTFRPVSPVVFVQVAVGLADCELIEQRVRTGPLVRDLTFAYHPHVTVAHHVDDADLDRAFDTLAGYDVTFPVTSFSLYEHGADGVWRPRRCYPFRRTGAGA